MSHIALVTGASSGFGRMIANALADNGHTVYASMRDIAGRNARSVADLKAHAAARQADLRPLELDVQSDAVSNAVIDRIREQFLARFGFDDLLHPTIFGDPA